MALAPCPSQEPLLVRWQYLIHHKTHWAFLVANRVVFNQVPFQLASREGRVRVLGASVHGVTELRHCDCRATPACDAAVRRPQPTEQALLRQSAALAGKRAAADVCTENKWNGNEAHTFPQDLPSACSAGERLLAWKRPPASVQRLSGQASVLHPGLPRKQACAS